MIALEGVYVTPDTDGGIPRFARFEPPTDQDVCNVVEEIAVKAIKLLRKKDYLQREGEEVQRPDLDPLFQDHPGMAQAMAASIRPGLMAPQPSCYPPRSYVKNSQPWSPPPNSHLTRYSGVFSSHSKWRKKIIPHPEKRTGFCLGGGTDRKKVRIHKWARLLARTFKVDERTCPRCGEDMEIMGAVHDGGEVQR